ncbi:alpha/beta hydrolase [bacterium]|nr:alpha/beta hydrolase [bacterium]
MTQKFTAEPRVFYTDTGVRDGEAVILSHAFPFTHEMWAPQVEMLNERWRVVTFDVRGLGQSDPGTGEFKLDDYVDDVLRIMDTLGIEKTVIGGLSMGGYVSMRLCERAPDRVRGLMLFSTRAEGDNADALAMRQRWIEIVKHRGVRPFAEDFLKKLFAPQTFVQAPQIIDHQLAIIEGHQPIGVIGTIRALATRPDMTASLAKVAVPTLIVYGEEDALTPVAIGREIQAKIAGSEFHVIPQAAHMCNLENPEQFNEKLFDFLTGLK